MKIKHLLRYFLALILVAALAAGIAACTSAPTLSSIAVTPASPSLVAGLGIEQQFTATGSYSDGSKTDISSVVTWTSSLTTIATISNNGFATGLATGDTIITASYAGITSPPVTLKVITLTSIAVTPAPTADVVSGTTQQLKATGTYSDGSTKDITAEVTWTTSNYVVTVASGGMANFRTAGKADITASALGVTSPAVSITVINKLSSIALVPTDPPALTVGSPKFFSATAMYSDGSTLDISHSATWASSDVAVAAPMPASPGGFTGVAPGTTKITASFEGITSQEVTLTVVAAAAS